MLSLDTTQDLITETSVASVLMSAPQLEPTKEQPAKLLDSELGIQTGYLLEKYKFRAVLNIYVTKNNVSWVLTDVTRSILFYKKTGGQICKRGTDKNSSKTTLKNFQTVMDIVKQLNIDYLFFYVNPGYGTKKHPSTTKNLIKILTLFKDTDINKYQEIINLRTNPTSTVRLKGGRRGRRP